ncbi:MAG: carbon storage regulator [Synergistaceae bacterium]|nr:carbon storage regulator [Synergistaceae bacterium]
MLIIGRRLNESIRIGRDIKITVTGIQAGIARLGIEAPRDFQIWRGELIESIEKENHRASYAARLYAEGEFTPQIPLSQFSRINALRTVPMGREK